MPAPTPHERLAARARRVAALRRGVIASACASFALGWAVIAYDGSMGVESASTSAATTTQVESSSTESATGSSSTESGSSTDSGSSTQSDDSAAVTTAQS